MPTLDDREAARLALPGGRFRPRVLKALASVVLCALAVSLLFAPDILNLYWIRVLSNVFMFAILAHAINIVAGYAGYPVFGNVVFFGLGAYSTAIVMVRYHGPFWSGLLAAVVVSTLFALVFGPALLRLRGHYFAIATLGFNEAVRAVVNNQTELTGGGQGLSLPLPAGGPVVNAALFYYLLYGTMMLSIVVTFWLSVSWLGYACRAVRDNEVKAESMGLPTMRCKTAAWMISAALTGLTGGIYAYWFSYIEPSAVFDMTIAVKSFVVFLLGGSATVLGPIFGAVAVELLATLTWSHFLDYHLMALGTIIIVIAIFLPNGMVAFLQDRLNLMRKLFAGGTRL